MFQRRLVTVARFKKAAWAFGIVGALSASTVTERGPFTIAFFWVMFGGIAGLLTLAASPNADEIVVPEIKIPDPFTDEFGVYRYPGDVFDIENHPRPGAHGRY